MQKKVTRYFWTFVVVGLAVLVVKNCCAQEPRESPEALQGEIEKDCAENPLNFVLMVQQTVLFDHRLTALQKVDTLTSFSLTLGQSLQVNKNTRFSKHVGGIFKDRPGLRPVFVATCLAIRSAKSATARQELARREEQERVFD